MSKLKLSRRFLLNLQKGKTFDIFVFILVFLFCFAGILVSLNRFWQYEVFYYDFGIFDQAIWRVSQFKAPIIEHLVVGGKWIFADHLNPSIFLLSPLYWFFKQSEVVLIAQAIIVGLSGLFIYKTAFEVLKNKLISFSILFSYYFFVGLQNAVITDFHEVTIMSLPLALTYWAFVKNKKVLFFVFLLIALGFKESTFLLGIGIGVSIVLLDRKWFREALITVIISIIWGILSIKLIIPFFSGGIYQYNPTLPASLINNIFVLFDDPLKRSTLFYSFLSFSFLPIFSPVFWFLIFQDFFTRFAPSFAYTRWGLGLHYSANLSVIFAISSIFSLYRLIKYKIILKLLPLISLLMIINSSFLYFFVLRGPFGLSYNPAFYKHSQNFDFLDDLISQVPKNASVMTQNNLASRFTHQEVYLLRSNYASYNPDYILIDARLGQNPNNYFGIEVSSLDDLIKNLMRDKNYTLVYSTNEQFVFQKSADIKKSNIY